MITKGLNELLQVLLLTLVFVISFYLFSLLRTVSRPELKVKEPPLSQEEKNKLKMINLTSRNLSRWKSVDLESIILKESKKQKFFDTSLNCPLPNKGYEPIVTDGWMFKYKIVAQPGEYVYFANKDKFLYCDT